MTQKTETAPRATFKLNDREFYVDSVTEDGNKITESINLVTQEIQRIQLQSDIAHLAKDTLVNNLVNISGEFEEVETEDVEDVEEVVAT